eukprot:scpid47048/ scgid25630/ Solute carrier family 13 member 2; Na(+)/dicarboxylate cotransporter 1; Renal sodium/dicarboxylate cotransporter
MFGVLTAREAAQAYYTDLVFLFYGGIFMAIAIESWDLHERIALRILLLVGSTTTTLFLGFMMITALLSMWISNAASTAMMLPIGQAVLDELSAGSESKQAVRRDSSEHEMIASGNEDASTTLDRPDPSHCANEVTTSSAAAATIDAVRTRKLSPKEIKLRKGMSLAVAYGANCGGIATLTGTPTNLVLVSLLQSLFPDYDNSISFGHWMAVGFPTTCLLLVLTWLWLTLVFDFRGSAPVRLWQWIRRSRNASYDLDRAEGSKRVKAFIRQRYDAMGPLKFAEKVILVVFAAFAVLLFFRRPGFMPGWEEFFPKYGENKSYVSDGTSAILVTLPLFFIPSSWPFPKSKFDSQSADHRRILEWDVVHKKMPWAVVLLVGAGLCLAKGAVESGLSCWFGENLSSLGDLDVKLVVFILVIFITFFTEIASNTATATIFLPIFAQLAVSTLNVNPLQLMVPGTVACSLAFMLPAATPANAIAFSYGHLKVIDMARIGFVLNIIGVLCVMFLTSTLYTAVFDFNTIPSWASQLSGASACTLANTTGTQNRTLNTTHVQ